MYRGEEGVIQIMQADNSGAKRDEWWTAGIKGDDLSDREDEDEEKEGEEKQVLHYYGLIVIFTKTLDGYVPLPSAFEEPFGSVVEHNFVTVLDVDGLVSDLLTQRGNMLRLEWGFDEFRKFFYGILQVSKIKINNQSLTTVLQNPVEPKRNN